jgi:hypothetical protein
VLERMVIVVGRSATAIEGNSRPIGIRVASGNHLREQRLELRLPTGAPANGPEVGGRYSCGGTHSLPIDRAPSNRRGRRAQGSSPCALLQRSYLAFATSKASL